MSREEREAAMQLRLEWALERARRVLKQRAEQMVIARELLSVDNVRPPALTSLCCRLGMGWMSGTLAPLNVMALSPWVLVI